MDYNFFDSIQDGILLLDSQRAVRFVNISFSNITGYSQKRILNKDIRELNIFSATTLEQINSLIKNGVAAPPFAESELLAQNQVKIRVQAGVCHFNESLFLLSIRDVSVEESLLKKYRNEIATKENYIEILNRKLFESQFMLDVVSTSVTDESIETYPSKAFDKIQKTLNIDLILVLNRGGDLQSSEVEISGAHVLNQNLLKFRGLIKETIDHWRSVDLNDLGIERPSFVTEVGGYSIVTSLVRGKQQQWKIFLFFFSSQNKQMAALNLPLLTSLSKQVYLMIENQSLFHLAVTDEKTQIYNSRFFLYRIENELQRAKRYKKDASLLLIDIDFFKKFNDVFGHLIGDFVLRQVAGAIKREFRACDVVARFGGEEFVVLCPETSLEQAQIIGERVRQAIERLELEVGEGKTTSVTISVGISTFSVDTENGKVLIKHADEALYLAKTAGRNRVECYKKILK